MEETLHERIVKISYELFLERSIKGVTMDMISTELGISKRTLYELFPSKVELVKSVSSFRTKVHAAERSAILSNTKIGTIERLFELMFINVDRQQREMLLIEEMSRLLPTLMRSLIIKNFDESVSLMANFVRQGLNEGVFVEGINFELTTELYLNMIMSYRYEFSVFKHHANRREAMVVMTILFFRGLSTQIGINEIERLCKIHNVNIFSKD